MTANTTESYVTEAGDTVDLIAYNRFGAHGAEADIFAANPGLASYGPLLPAGVTIIIPVPGVADRSDTQNLWGSGE